MTITVVCNLADGLVLGVDSAVTVTAADGNVLKVYNDAEKLFTLYDLPIGMVAFGTAALKSRTIQSYMGVDYVRFLLDIMINQTRFVTGAPMCGGRVRLAVIKGDGVHHVTATPFQTSH